MPGAPAVDSLAGSTPGGGGSAQTWTHTTGSGPDGLLLVCAAASSALLPSSVTYGGAALTHLQSAESGSGSTDRDVDTWYMLAPPPGAASVTCTYATTTAGISAESVTFTGVSQSSPFGSTGTFASTSAGTAATVTTSPASALLLSFICARATTAPSPGSGETSQWALLGGTNIYGAGATQPGGAGVTSQFTFSPADHCAMITIPLLGAQAASAASNVVAALVASGATGL